jgi:hypothetical protein
MTMVAEINITEDEADVAELLEEAEEALTEALEKDYGFSAAEAAFAIEAVEGGALVPDTDLDGDEDTDVNAEPESEPESRGGC